VILCEAYETLREGLELALGERYEVTSGSLLQPLLFPSYETTPALLIVDVDGQPDPVPTLATFRTSFPSVPILLLAGAFSLEQQMDAVRRVGHVGFVTKPFALEYLLEKVQTLIQGYSSSPIRRRIVRIAQ
jgi:DNA-binding response OmpR family regulator